MRAIQGNSKGVLQFSSCGLRRAADHCAALRLSRARCLAARALYLTDQAVKTAPATKSAAELFCTANPAPDPPLPRGRLHHDVHREDQERPPPLVLDGRVRELRQDRGASGPAEEANLIARAASALDPLRGDPWRAAGHKRLRSAHLGWLRRCGKRLVIAPAADREVPPLGR